MTAQGLPYGERVHVTFAKVVRISLDGSSVRIVAATGKVVGFFGDWIEVHAEVVFPHFDDDAREPDGDLANRGLEHRVVLCLRPDTMGAVATVPA